MKSKIVKNVEVKLSLDEDEAKWLKSLMQNPIGCLPDEEDIMDKQIRHKFWKALSEIND